jgi:hypothetical protein
MFGLIKKEVLFEGKYESLAVASILLGVWIDNEGSAQRCVEGRAANSFLR